LDISIPFGAIKRDLPRCDGAIYIISIPFGAIKSDPENLEKIHLFEFQFLLVRLKDTKNGRTSKIRHYFNSFWCD